MEGMRLRKTQLTDITPLQLLEKAAAERFLAIPALAFIAEMAATESDTHRVAIARELSWLIESERGEIAGFCYCEPQERSLYLAEISTHPAFQRRGIGRQLLRHVREDAGRLGYHDITLTTYRDVAWNAPWYSRMGFTCIAPQHISTELARHLEEQREAGMMVQPRVAMRLAL